jgi:predicted acetyltransferase
LNHTVIAVSPSADRQRAFLAMLDDFDARDPHNTAFYAPARQDFAQYVQSLLDEEAGRNLPDGFVPCTHRWLVEPNGEVVGVTRLRQRIDTPALAENSGHIGYDVAPSKRRRGYGHLALAVALAEARRLGIARALLYIDEGNAASRATAERAGGVLEAVAWSEFWQERVCKYWIEVTQ